VPYMKVSPPDGRKKVERRKHPSNKDLKGAKGYSGDKLERREFHRNKNHGGQLKIKLGLGERE